MNSGSAWYARCSIRSTPKRSTSSQASRANFPFALKAYLLLGRRQAGMVVVCGCGCTPVHELCLPPGVYLVLCPPGVYLVLCPAGILTTSAGFEKKADRAIFYNGFSQPTVFFRKTQKKTCSVQVQFIRTLGVFRHPYCMFCDIYFTAGDEKSGVFAYISRFKIGGNKILFPGVYPRTRHVRNRCKKKEDNCVNLQNLE